MRVSAAMIALVALSAGCGRFPGTEREPAPAAERATRAVKLASIARPAAMSVAASGQLSIVLPPMLGEAARVARTAQDGVFVDVRDRDVAPVSRRTLGADAVYLDAATATDVVLATEAGRLEELRVVHQATDTITVKQAVTLGPALRSMRVVEGFVEVLDGDGVARLRAERALAVDARGTRREMSVAVERSGDEFLVTWTLDGRGLEAPIAIDPAWTATASLAVARRSHMAAWLESKKRVLVMGGGGIAEQLASTELYDPATASWTMGAPMSTARYYSGVAVLASGKVLVVGSGNFHTTDGPTTAEVYDPATNSWSPTGVTGAVVGAGTLQYPSADRLASGKVLVVYQSFSLLYDPATNAWTQTTGQPTDPRRAHASAVTKNAAGKERVLIAGGYSPLKGVYLKTAESFDPETGTWTPAPDMKVLRSFYTVVPLSNRKILVPGGYRGDGSIDPGNKDCELWDPDTNTFTAGPDMNFKHSISSTAVLSPTQTIIMGGDLDSELTDVTEIYDVTTNKWTLSGKMTDQREDFTATLLPPAKAGGAARVLVAAGSNGGIVRTAEIFDPIVPGKACTEAGECASGACVEGTCCATATCGTGETCANPFGKCLKINGGACKADTECSSAHCVDGYCCNEACGGQCQACDVGGKLGTCTTVPAGDAPHGGDFRSPCVGVGGCAGKCGGGDAYKCTSFPGSSTTCSAASCAAGKQSIASGCDGKGGCTTPVVTACAPFACGDTACKAKCASKTDCADGYDCDDRGMCIVGAKCDGVSIAIDAKGNTHDCSPIRCAAGACLTRCMTSADCVGGFYCDDSGACVAPQLGSDDSSSGCSYGRPTTTGGEILLGLLVAALVRASRKNKPLRS